MKTLVLRLLLHFLILSPLMAYGDMAISDLNSEIQPQRTLSEDRNNIENIDPASVKPDFLIGYWPMNPSNSNSIVDLSGYNNHGSLVSSDRAQWTSSPNSGAIQLDGVETSIVIGDNTILQPEALTIAAWVKPDPTSSEWSWVAGEGDNYGLVINRSGSEDLHFYYYNGAEWVSHTAYNVSIKDGEWHHIAASFEPKTSEIVLYADGIRLSSVNQSGTIQYDRSSGFTIGSMQGRRLFKGELDEIRVYSTPLTDADIAVLARRPTQPLNQPPNVIAGEAQTIRLPENELIVDSLIADDGYPDNADIRYFWKQLDSNPAATIRYRSYNNSNLRTVFSFAAAGSYHFRLNASDGEYGVSDDIWIDVLEPDTTLINQAPVLDAGGTHRVTLPENTLKVLSTYSDDGLPSEGSINFKWKQLTGPSEVRILSKIQDTDVLTTMFEFKSAGNYKLRLFVYDGDLSSHDDIQIEVEEIADETANRPPGLSATFSRHDVLVDETLDFTFSTSDDNLPAGQPLKLKMVQIDGPDQAIIGDLSGDVPGIANNSVYFPTAGSYRFGIHLSDGELTSSQTIVITVQEVALTPGPSSTQASAIWHLDENKGLATVDSSGNGHNAVFENLGSAAWSEGVFHSSICLDGTPGSHIEVKGPAPLLQSQSVTIAAWVKVNPELTKWTWVAAQGNNYGLVVNRFNNDDLLFYIYNGRIGESASINYIGLKDGQWHHIAGSFNHSNQRISLYLDGALLTQKKINGRIAYKTGNHFTIGSLKGLRVFDGCIDEVQVYDRALSTEEIQQLLP